MSESKPPRFDFSNAEMLASALHAQLLARRRATLEHDVKNVIHGLLSGTELLAKSLNTSSARVTPAECLTLLQQQLARAQTTLNRLLDEVAPTAQAPADIELAQFVSECTHALRHQLQPLRLEIAVPQGMRIHAVPALLKDALLSIMLDCIDRAPVRSSFSVNAALAADDTRVALTLRHSQSAAAQPSPVLMAIQPLLEADGAHIDLAGGSGEQRTIEVSWPLVATPAARERVFDLLIVDASRDAADSLTMLLQLEGFGAEACYDITTAIEAIRARAPTAVIIDLDGSVDSQGLVRTIRSANGQQPRLLGLSHSQSPALIGFDASIRKPLDIAALRHALA